MKKVITLSLTILICISCSQEGEILEKQPLRKNGDLNTFREKAELSLEQMENWSRKFEESKSASEARYQKSIANGKTTACLQTVFVPDDYPTIQEAIDAVCDNGNVFVRSGIYFESPGIFKPGLFIKAIGDVTLKGGFGLAADNVKIHGFKIHFSYSEWSVGIGSRPGYNGFDIKHNTIYSSGIYYPGNPAGFAHLGIYFEYCDNATIIENTISGEMEAGIYIDAIRIEGNGWDIGYGPGVHPFGSNSNNTISNNTITDIFGNVNNNFPFYYPGFGIVLRGNVDNTTVEGNNVDTSNGYGITLWSVQELGLTCDNNIVKNNSFKTHLHNGIDIFNGGSNNTIGPNNESNYNGEVGILLYEFSSNNHVFNNTAMSNTTCDIVNEGTLNTFKNNTAGCTFGVD